MAQDTAYTNGFAGIFRSGTTGDERASLPPLSKRYLKNAVIVIYLAAVLTSALVVPFFRDSIVRAVQSYFQGSG